ncbi:hypothetical protein IE81DRAFT_319191 [Ceraceosorus guamensis]|uniref:C2 domain-containing protein n=1 Tax=Ceraceosorus guamensis TaxID=1522189 RepID=A0A316W9W6_9BASI|nr:hypothetical protein IE81DRAFT_319191 [Ceraceosorus guamensis]PWN46304.1 hypothetical protein IE81DRAFT_319191 [Ceraceosorus guamensis]
MTSAAEPRHRGTLVCVVLKAKNLPNKRSIGKQDPYCVLTLGSETQKTDPDKKGGQHPVWDSQLHFEIFEDVEDMLKRTAGDGDVDANATLKAGSSTSAAKKGKATTNKALKVTCYADDKNEPEFIGEGMIDLTETLKTGEFDEWVTIKAKDRYAGEVYLELTFYSSAAPPRKKKAAKPVVSGNGTYGGAGTFVADIDDEFEVAPRLPAKAAANPSGHAPIPSSMRPGRASFSGAGAGHEAQSSAASTMSHSRTHGDLGSFSSTPDEIPSTLRPSSSLAQISAYTPPYAPSTMRAPSPAPPSRTQDPSATLRTGSYPPPKASHHAQQNSSDAISSIPYSASGHPSSTSSTATLRPGAQNWPGGELADELLRPMSSMSFSSQSNLAERPLPPPTPSNHWAPPQPTPSPHGAPAPPQSPSPYAYSGQPGPPQQPQQAYAYPPPVAPTPPIHPSSAPPGHAYLQDPPQPQQVYTQAYGYSQPQQSPAPPPSQHQQQQQHPNYHPQAGLPPPPSQPSQGYEPPRAPSPAPRPHSTASYHALPNVPPPPTASVVNAQSLYQSSTHLSQPPAPPPPRAPSPSPSVAHSTTQSSIYAPPPPPQSFFAMPAHSSPPSVAHRPLPSTQPPPSEYGIPSHHHPPPAQQYYVSAPQYGTQSGVAAPGQYMYGQPPIPSAQSWPPPPPQGAPTPGLPVQAPPGVYIPPTPPPGAVYAAPHPPSHELQSHPPPPHSHASHQQMYPQQHGAPPPPPSGHHYPHQTSLPPSHHQQQQSPYHYAPPPQ